MSNLYTEKRYFTGKSVGDQPRSFANFDLLLFLFFSRADFQIKKIKNKVEPQERISSTKAE